MSRQARSLDVLLDEINNHAPGRYKASDGGIGDPAHAGRVSDHNPNAAGVWRAVDVTNDADDHDGNPKNDLPGRDLATRLVLKFGEHPAMKSGSYVIFNHQIISFDRLDEGWRPYAGVNAHEKHVHLSVSTAAAGYDSQRTWNLWPAVDPKPDLDRLPTLSDIKVTLERFAERTANDKARGLYEEAIDDLSPLLDGKRVRVPTTVVGIIAVLKIRRGLTKGAAQARLDAVIELLDPVK